MFLGLLDEKEKEKEKKKETRYHGMPLGKERTFRAKSQINYSQDIWIVYLYNKVMARALSGPRSADKPRRADKRARCEHLPGGCTDASEFKRSFPISLCRESVNRARVGKYLASAEFNSEF